MGEDEPRSFRPPSVSLTPSLSPPAALLRRCLGPRLSLVLPLCFLGAPATARATGDDFLNETLVAIPLGAREIGVEFNADSRIDRDYRMQGWFTTEFEAGVSRALMLEGRASYLNRGRGLEFAGWTGEGRLVAFEQGRMPLGMAAVVELESETSAAKHLGTERNVGFKAVATRTFRDAWLATANLGWQRAVVPTPRRGRTLALGVRFPERAEVTYGFEYRHEWMERLIEYGPSLRLRLPNHMRLRLGGFMGEGARRYRFIARAILETEL